VIGARQYREMESSSASAPPAGEPVNIKAAGRPAERETSDLLMAPEGDEKGAGNQRAQERRQEETAAEEHQAAWPDTAKTPQAELPLTIQRLGKEQHITPAEADRTSEGWLRALYSQGGSPDHPSGKDRGQRVAERHHHARGGHPTF
jgi:hypothetical protein